MKHLQLISTLLAGTLLAAGCSSGNSGDAGNAGANASTPMSLHGAVHGGQAPIVGAAVTLYAASQQPLSPAAAVASAMSDGNGNFTFSSFTCPSPGAQMYVTSTGGNPGGGVNSAIHLMAILGQCQSLHRSVTVNELTTVAAAYTANQFIGPSGCLDCTSGVPDAVDNISGGTPGLPNAMGNAALLVDAASGLDAAALPTLLDCGAASPPANCATLRKLNSLGNALAACVNSSGPASAQCAELLDCAVPHATYTSNACTLPAGAVAPTDTLQAILSIARNPATASLTGIYQAAGQNVVFAPKLIAAATDFALALDIANLSGPRDLAVDAAGNVWVANFTGGGVTKLSPNGVVLSGPGFFSGGLTSPSGIAIDASGNAWISNESNNSLSVLDSSGAAILGSPITIGGLNHPRGVAISPTGDVWVANHIAAGTVSRFNSVGSTFGSGYAIGNTPQGVAVDAAGYAWVTNNGDSTLGEVSPFGVYLTSIGTGGVSGPLGDAIDINGNIWVANGGNSSLSKITVASDNFVNGSNVTGGGLDSAQSVAVDAAGNVWAADGLNNSVAEFNVNGTALSPAGGFVGGGLNSPGKLAVDPSGNVWVSNLGNNTLTVLFGAAAPTRTPLVSAIVSGFTP
jgi:streptogramin lyase